MFNADQTRTGGTARGSSLRHGILVVVGEGKYCDKHARPGVSRPDQLTAACFASVVDPGLVALVADIVSDG